MPCGCTKKAGAKGWVLVAADSSETSFNTEIEARAARIRAGGGEVKPK